MADFSPEQQQLIDNALNTLGIPASDDMGARIDHGVQMLVDLMNAQAGAGAAKIEFDPEIGYTPELGEVLLENANALKNSDNFTTLENVLSIPLRGADAASGLLATQEGIPAALVNNPQGLVDLVRSTAQTIQALNAFEASQRPEPQTPSEEIKPESKQPVETPATETMTYEAFLAESADILGVAQNENWQARLLGTLRQYEAFINHSLTPQTGFALNYNPEEGLTPEYRQQFMAGLSNVTGSPDFMLIHDQYAFDVMWHEKTEHTASRMMQDVYASGPRPLELPDAIRQDPGQFFYLLQNAEHFLTGVHLAVTGQHDSLKEAIDVRSLPSLEPLEKTDERLAKQTLFSLHSHYSQSLIHPGQVLLEMDTDGFDQNYTDLIESVLGSLKQDFQEIPGDGTAFTPEVAAYLKEHIPNHEGLSQVLTEAGVGGVDGAINSLESMTAQGFLSNRPTPQGTPLPEENPTEEPAPETVTDEMTDEIRVKQALGTLADMIKTKAKNEGGARFLPEFVEPSEGPGFNQSDQKLLQQVISASKLEFQKMPGNGWQYSPQVGAYLKNALQTMPEKDIIESAMSGYGGTDAVFASLDKLHEKQALSNKRLIEENILATAMTNMQSNMLSWVVEFLGSMFPGLIPMVDGFFKQFAGVSLMEVLPAGAKQGLQKAVDENDALQMGADGRISGPEGLTGDDAVDHANAYKHALASVDGDVDELSAGVMRSNQVVSALPFGDPARREGYNQAIQEALEKAAAKLDGISADSDTYQAKLEEAAQEYGASLTASLNALDQQYGGPERRPAEEPFVQDPTVKDINIDGYTYKHIYQTYLKANEGLTVHNDAPLVFKDNAGTIYVAGTEAESNIFSIQPLGNVSGILADLIELDPAPLPHQTEEEAQAYQAEVVAYLYKNYPGYKFGHDTGAPQFDDLLLFVQTVHDAEHFSDVQAKIFDLEPEVAHQQPPVPQQTLESASVQASPVQAAVETWPRTREELLAENDRVDDEALKIRQIRAAPEVLVGDLGGIYIRYMEDNEVLRTIDVTQEMDRFMNGFDENAMRDNPSYLLENFPQLSELSRHYPQYSDARDAAFFNMRTAMHDLGHDGRFDLAWRYDQLRELPEILHSQYQDSLFLGTYRGNELHEITHEMQRFMGGIYNPDYLEDAGYLGDRFPGLSGVVEAYPGYGDALAVGNHVAERLGQPAPQIARVQDWDYREGIGEEFGQHRGEALYKDGPPNNGNGAPARMRAMRDEFEDNALPQDKPVLRGPPKGRDAIKRMMAKREDNDHGNDEQPDPDRPNNPGFNTAPR